MSDELPEGWAEAKLADVTIRVPNVKPESEPAREFAYVDISAVDRERNEIVVPSVRRFCGKDAPSRARRPIESGDVLFSNVRTNLRNVAAVPDPAPAQLCSNGFTVLRSNGAVLPLYLLRSVLTDEFTAAVSETQTGTHYPATTDAQVFEQGVRVPPLAEQRRIVAKVEALLEQVRRAKDRLDRVPLILKRFRQAVLAAALTGKLTEQWRQAHPEAESVGARQQRIGATNEMSRRRRGRGTTGLSECDPPDDLPESWLVDSVRGLVERGVILDFQDGNHGSLYPRSSEFGDAGTKFITAKQVFDGRVLFAEAPLLANDRAAQLRIGFAQPGDVLLTHNATVGRVAVLPEAAGNCMLGTSVTYYRLRPELMLPTFCMHFMQSRLWQQQLEQVMEQTTRNQVSVRKQAELWMVVPPPDEQVEIASRVGSLLACAGSIQQRIEQATVRAGSLPQSILSKAFAGELVPTEADLARAEGRDYETAKQLLKRIQSTPPAARAATPRPSARAAPRR